MLLNDNVYKWLKFGVQILLPALSAAYFALGQIWNFPNIEQIVGTLAVLTTFLGAILGVSSKTYNNRDDKYDGIFLLEDTEDGTQLRLQDVHIGDLTAKKEMLFKVNH